MTASGSNIMVGTYPDGVYLSTDKGSNWNAVNNGLKGYKNVTISALASINDNFFVGTDSGVFMSTNNGISWNNVSKGLGNDTINLLQVVNSDLFVGTRQGTWRRPLAELISTKSVSSNSQSITSSVHQNYPNPFGNETCINFSVPFHQHVRMTMSNVLGEQLQPLVDEDMDAGTHELTIKGSDLSNGIYVITMFTGVERRTLNIVVQK